MRQKYPATELEIDTIGKLSMRVVCIDGISTALCAGTWCIGISSKNTTMGTTDHGVSSYNFHGSSSYIVINCHMGYKIGVKYKRITLFIKFYSEVHHLYAFYTTKKFKLFLS